MDFGPYPHALLCLQDEVAAVNDVIEELQGTLALTKLNWNIGKFGKQFRILLAPWPLLEWFALLRFPIDFP